MAAKLSNDVGPPQFVATQILLICVDIFAAFVFAVCAFWFLAGFRFGLWLPADDAVSMLVNFYTGHVTRGALLAELLAASTTFIPSAVFLGVLGLILTLKSVASSVTVSVTYVLRARIEDSEPKAFTVLGLAVGIVIMLARVLLDM